MKRKSLLAIAVGLLVYFCLKYPQKIFKIVFISAIIFAVAYICLMEIPFLYDSIGHRMESLFSLMAGGEGDDSAEARQEFIELGMKYFRMSPALGNGLNCFTLLTWTYSHNNYVELLFSVGVLGTVAYYLMYVSVAVRAIRQYSRRRSNASILAITLIVVCLLMDIAMVSYYERSAILFLILCNTLSKEKKHNKAMPLERVNHEYQKIS